MYLRKIYPRRLLQVVCNCTVLVIAVTWPRAPAEAQELYFPGETWQTVAPRDAGLNPTKLDEVLDFAESRMSSSVVILYSGRIVAERHVEVASPAERYQRMITGKTADGHVIEDVASVQKVIASFVIGVAIEKGLVDLDDPVEKHLGQGWSKANRQQESAIQLRHLVTMTSGLDTKLRYLAPAGGRWAYNTNAYAKSKHCVEAASALSANELTSQWLLDKIGMNNSSWAERAWVKSRDVDAASFGFATTARDLARFGLLILAGGQWDGEVILGDKAFLRASMSPSQSLNPAYGYLWWLNGQASRIRGTEKVAGPLIESAPNDLVAGLGALGRKCYVCPSLGLVVTRLGDNPGRDFDNEFWRRLMLAVND